jgi:hypothetical protein
VIEGHRHQIYGQCRRCVTRAAAGKADAKAEAKSDAKA